MTVEEFITKFEAFKECGLKDQHVVIKDEKEERPISKIVFNVPTGNFQIIPKAKGWSV